MNIRCNTYLLLLFSLCCCISHEPEHTATLSNLNGLKLIVVEKDYPLIKVLLPEQAASERGIEIEFPEHVTAINETTGRAEHLYLTTNRYDASRKMPVWETDKNTVTYKTTFDGLVEMTAIARLEEDGIRYIYKLNNKSKTSFRNLQAVTCVKLYSAFSDTLMERMYVHHANGFDLLASETPERLTMPLGKWLPCRYLVSYEWPVPAKLIEKDEDGITRYIKSRKTDKPFIATMSHDKKWIAATFTKSTGNLWTNPERSCQHADPVTDLKAGGTATLELKTFIIKGSLDQVLALVNKEMKN